MLDQQLDHLTSLKDKFDKSAWTYRKARQGALEVGQIKEARATNTLAVAVNRLSKLAFVFVPLTFATSVFGMNLHAFGQGTVTLRMVVITAVLVSVISLVPMLPVAFRAPRSNFFGANCRTMLKLLRFHPIGALQYLGLLLTYDYEVVDVICGGELRRALDIPGPTGMAEDAMTIGGAFRLRMSGHPSRRFFDTWDRRAESLKRWAIDRQVSRGTY